MYPLTDIDDLDLLNTNDEEVLFLLVSMRTGLEPRRDLSYRPIFGIHMSTNRTMVHVEDDGLDWGISLQRARDFFNIVGLVSGSSFFRLRL